MAKTYIIPNIHIQKMGYTRDGRTAEELIAQAGDVLNERKNASYPSLPAPTQSGQNQRDDITSMDNKFIKFAREMTAKTGGSAYPGYMPIRKAMYSSPSVSHNGGGNVMMTPPQFYSPIHTPVNWQIPTKRREVYMWCRFFANNNATINASLRFYSEFPFTDYSHVMTNAVRKEHYDKLKERLKIQQLIPQIALEFFTMGDAFPFVSIDCPECGGWGKKKDGSQCDHKNGRIGTVTVLNPDLVDVKASPINPNIKIISLVPDETLISIVNSKQPKEIYDMIPDNIKRLIVAKQPIPLNPKSILHLKHRDIPYITYGMSLLAPLFPILAYLDRLRQAQWIVAERHILPIKICKVGNDQRPAGPQDIADVRAQLATTANDPNLTLVVHHAFDFEWVGAAGKVLQLTKEYELVDKEIIKGLGVNEALLSGQGPSYSQAAIGIEATIRRLRNVQALFSWWIIEYIYKPEARMKGFYRSTKSGDVELDVPEIRWDDLNLRDETQKENQAVSLWEKQAISTQTLHEKLGYDYDVEVERIRMEQQYQLQMGIAPQGGDKKGGFGGGFGGGGGLPGGGGGGMGGNLPGGQDGPGLPGDEMAPSMSGGEDAGGGAMESSDIQLMIQNYENAKKVKPKVHRPRKYRLTEPRIPRTKPEMVDQPELYEGRTGAVNLTELERLLYGAIERGQQAGQLPANFIWQQQPEPVKFPRIVVDGLFPDVKLIVQADGEQWHSSPKDIQKDQEIDARLASCGWTVLRFTEEEIKTSMDAILAKIIQTYKELRSPKTANKTFSFGDMIKIASFDYVQDDVGKTLYGHRKSEEHVEENLVDRISKAAHEHFIDSVFDATAEETPTIKVASKIAGKEIDIITTSYYELPEDIQNEYSKFTILALDDICVAMNDGVEVDKALHESIAKDLYEADGGTREWEDLDDDERSRYLFYPRKASEIIFEKKSKEG